MQYHCLGITEKNCAEVQWCIDTPEEDKLVVDAAHHLYKTLNPTNEPMTKDVFLYKVRNSTFSSNEKKMLEKAGTNAYISWIFLLF